MHLFSILAKTIMCESQIVQATEGNSTAGGKITDNNEWAKESASLQLVGEVSLGDLIWVKVHGNSWWPALVVDEKSVSESSKPGGKSQGKVLVRLYGSHEYFYADPVKYHSEFKTILEQNNGNCYDILDKTLEQLRRKSIKPKGQGSKATANTGADASKGKTSKQDETPKKPKRKSPSTDKQAKNKAVEQLSVQKKQRKNNQTAEKKKPNGRSAKEKSKSSTSKEQKRGKTSKQYEAQKKSKPNSPRTSKEENMLKEETGSQSSEGASPGESPKSGTRRTRVMQDLGLIAPPGSPFDKNGLI
ncbi:putative oxidoreductase GLYR1 isoform X1 [Hibiscus syriacus]|uniref:putative oxidoreductase GLYR1 isoform X1 n=1 Tax=Hibiscus syriacus TaxID=106335 RepID=UPI0019221788|nr:putative oxidoreductase GLYR1 isoform X1 [Hibiscus syriacus]